MRINMKSKGILFISYFEKQDDKLVKVDEKMAHITRKNFEQSIKEDFEKGITHKIEYVTERPEKINLGVIYILNTPKGRPDYLYTFQLN